MNILGNVKRVVGQLLGVDIYVFGPKTYQIINKDKLESAWFSLPAMIESIINEYSVDIVFDVGANKGQFVQRLRQYYKGPVVSFEPVPSTFSILQEIAADDDNWHVLNYALGSESKEEYINVSKSEGYDEFASLLDTNQYCVERFGDKTTDSNKERILLRCFDDIKNEIPFNIEGKKIFLKMDTQGFDLEVFQGISSIKDNIVGLLSEVSHKAIYKDMPHWTHSIDVYEQAGFLLAGLYPVNKDGFQYIESDCLMVKSN